MEGNVKLQREVEEAEMGKKVVTKR